MKQVLLFLFFVLLISCHSNIPRANQTFIVEGVRGHHLDSLITPYVKELRNKTHNTAALAIGVALKDQIIYARTFGYADIEFKKHANLDTRFHIASVTKPFSAIAIAHLIQKNKISLDDPIIKYIPTFKMQGEGFEKITVEHILTHTSGIPRHIAIDDWLDPSYGPKALEENIEIVNQLELDFEPGTQYNYSNSAFDILGIVISEASGMPFDEYIVQEILEPAGMMHSTFKKPEGITADDWAQAHSYGLQTQVLTPFPYNERLFPSSGMVSSVLDMCKWGQLHLGKGTIDNVEILDAAHYDLVTTPKYDTPWGDKIGLSWFLQSYLDRPLIMHTGADTGFESMMYIYPEDDISIIVMANRDFSRTGRIINAVSEVLFDDPIKEYNISAKYPFAKTYKESGLKEAVAVWETLKKDTLDNYFVDDDDILTTGALLTNGENWTDAKTILTHYLTINNNSTYAWRLLGNANLNLGDTATAITCYEKTLSINPNYDKGRKALEELLKK